MLRISTMDRKLHVFEFINYILYSYVTLDVLPGFCESPFSHLFKNLKLIIAIS